MSKESFHLFKGMLIGANKISALKALTIAEEVHKGIMRKDGVTPYIEHPVKVASLLFELGIQQDDILAIAILHDVLEDCKDEDRERLRKRLYNTFDHENAALIEREEQISRSTVKPIISLIEGCPEVCKMLNGKEDLQPACMEIVRLLKAQYCNKKENSCD